MKTIVQGLFLLLAFPILCSAAKNVDVQKANIIATTETFSANPSTKKYCAFCDREVLQSQKFYEDDLILALYTHKPILPGHCLIIPKRHVERFEMLTDEEITQIGRVIKKTHSAATQVFTISSYLILQKNGLDVGQTVPHVHFHYIPRKAGDNSTLKFLIKMYITNAQKPLSKAKMQKVVEKMKKAMQPA